MDPSITPDPEDVPGLSPQAADAITALRDGHSWQVGDAHFTVPLIDGRAPTAEERATLQWWSAQKRQEMREAGELPQC